MAAVGRRPFTSGDKFGHQGARGSQYGRQATLCPKIFAVNLLGEPEFCFYSISISWGNVELSELPNGNTIQAPIPEVLGLNNFLILLLTCMEKYTKVSILHLALEPQLQNTIVHQVPSKITP